MSASWYTFGGSKQTSSLPFTGKALIFPFSENLLSFRRQQALADIPFFFLLRLPVLFFVLNMLYYLEELETLRFPLGFSFFSLYSLGFCIAGKKSLASSARAIWSFPCT